MFFHLSIILMHITVVWRSFSPKYLFHLSLLFSEIVTNMHFHHRQKTCLFVYVYSLHFCYRMFLEFSSFALLICTQEALINADDALI